MVPQVADSRLCPWAHRQGLPLAQAMVLVWEDRLCLNMDDKAQVASMATRMQRRRSLLAGQHLLADLVASSTVGHGKIKTMRQNISVAAHSLTTKTMSQNSTLGASGTITYLLDPALSVPAHTSSQLSRSAATATLGGLLQPERILLQARLSVVVQQQLGEYPVRQHHLDSTLDPR